MINTEKPATVGKMVAQDYRKANVFKSFGIDFCCGGGITLDKACEIYKVDLDELKGALAKIDVSVESKAKDFDNWPVDKLVDYIVNEHHTYVKAAIPIVREYVNKVKSVHGENKPNVSEIADLFNALADELTGHLQKEEIILFPYIKKMAAVKNGETVEGAHFGNVKNPVSAMMHEHDNAGEILHRIEELTEGYHPPVGACATHTVSYATLKEFGEDLMTHIHLENNILFPKAIELEKELMA